MSRPTTSYWPIPDSRQLRNYDFDGHFERDGIALDDTALLDFLEQLKRYRPEYVAPQQPGAFPSNGDGAMLYAMIRHVAPRRVIEVGAGCSTAIIRSALDRNGAEDGPGNVQVTSIEPYPSAYLLDTIDRHADTHKLIAEPVQSVARAEFESLQDGDVLFIDSSHVLAVGSDVQYLILQVLPVLAKGVWIHFHDIRYPQDYPRSWVLKQRQFWSEQYLLQAFLAFNSSFHDVLPGNYMYRRHPDRMREAFADLPTGGEGWPGSFWIRRAA
jgi:hypothetical protein